MSVPALRMLRQEDGEGLACLLSATLLNDPVASWLVPDPQSRAPMHHQYLRVLTDFVLEHGIAYGTPDLSGAALWIDALRHRKSITDLDAKLHHVCGEWTARFLMLDDLLRQVHPHNPHWHLVSLAVRADQQNNGLGSALLHHHHQALDEHGLAAFLTASSEHNRRLFARTGYLDLTEPVGLADGGPLIWPMWREPRRAPEASSRH